MIVNKETAEYVMAVIKAVQEHRIDEVITNYCPECNQDLYEFNVQDHIAYVASENPDVLVLIVACEGYWVINPNLVGFNRPNWTDQNGMSPMWAGIENRPNR